MKLYFGKLSKEYPEQLNENFYAARDEGSSWYGGIQPGDYVFPIFNGKISKLWKVKEYGQKQNRINIDNPGAVFFETVKHYTKPISLADEFLRYKYFELDLNLLNKSAKSTQGTGFHEIKTFSNCPVPENIVIENNIRKIIISFPSYTHPNLSEGDIRILLDDFENTKIQNMEIIRDGLFVKYDTLWNIYEDRNPVTERYSLKKLLEYAKIDNAPKKENFLLAVLEELKEKGFFLITNPIALYDNIIVGRKVTKSRNLNLLIPKRRLIQVMNQILFKILANTINLLTFFKTIQI